MAVIAHVVLRDVTPEQYDAVRAEVGWLEQAPAGGLGHLTWWEGADCHNVDAWESEQAFTAFGEQRLGPAMAKLGITTAAETSFHPAHEVFTPRVQRLAPTAPTAAGPDNAAILRSGYAAFARGDIAAVLALFDESITWYSPDTVPGGGTYVGPARVAEFFGALPDNYAELSVQPISFVGDGDTVAVLGHHSGRSTTGATFDLPFVHVWTLSNGRATSFTEHVDTVKMNVALGIPVQRIDITESERARTR